MHRKEINRWPKEDKRNGKTGVHNDTKPGRAGMNQKMRNDFTQPRRLAGKDTVI